MVDKGDSTSEMYYRQASVHTILAFSSMKKGIERDRTIDDTEKDRRLRGLFEEYAKIAGLASNPPLQLYVAIESAASTANQEAAYRNIETLLAGSESAIQITPKKDYVVDKTRLYSSKETGEFFGVSPRLVGRLVRGGYLEKKEDGITGASIISALEKLDGYHILHKRRVYLAEQTGLNTKTIEYRLRSNRFKVFFKNIGGKGRSSLCAYEIPKEEEIIAGLKNTAAPRKRYERNKTLQEQLTDRVTMTEASKIAGVHYSTIHTAVSKDYIKREDGRINLYDVLAYFEERKKKSVVERINDYLIRQKEGGEKDSNYVNVELIVAEQGLAPGSTSNVAEFLRQQGIRPKEGGGGALLFDKAQITETVKKELGIKFGQ